VSVEQATVERASFASIVCYSAERPLGGASTVVGTKVIQRERVSYGGASVGRTAEPAVVRRSQLSYGGVSVANRSQCPIWRENSRGRQQQQ